jgi:hypothetical protein
VAVARTDLAQLIAAGRSGQPSPSWHKYLADGTWSTVDASQDTGTPANLLAGAGAPDDTDGHISTSGGAIYSTWANRYYLALPRLNPNVAGGADNWTAIHLYQSTDGIHWALRTRLQTTWNTGDQGFHYVSLESIDSKTFPYPQGLTSNCFYIYYQSHMGGPDNALDRATVCLDQSDCNKAGGC